MRCGNIIDVSLAIADPESLADINSLLTLRTVPMNQELTEDATSLCWIPIDQSVVGFCDPSYNAPINTNDLRNSQVLLYCAKWETGAGTLPALNVYTNHNFIPYESLAHLYRCDVALGSDAEIAAVEAFIFNGKSPLDVVNGVGADFSWDGLWETIKGGIGKVLRWTTPFVSTVEKGLGVAKNVLGVAGSLGLMAEHHKQVAIFLAAVEKHQKECAEGRVPLADQEAKFPVFTSPFKRSAPQQAGPSATQVRAVLDYIQRTSLPALSVSDEEYVPVKRAKI